MKHERSCNNRQNPKIRQKSFRISGDIRIFLTFLVSDKNLIVVSMACISRLLNKKQLVILITTTTRMKIFIDRVDKHSNAIGFGDDKTYLLWFIV